jgi:hypothetical protein
MLQVSAGDPPLTIGLTASRAEGLLCLAGDNNVLLELAAIIAIGCLKGPRRRYRTRVTRIGVLPSHGVAGGCSLECALRRLVRDLSIPLIKIIADRAAEQPTDDDAGGNRCWAASGRGRDQSSAGSPAKAPNCRSCPDPGATAALLASGQHKGQQDHADQQATAQAGERQ